MQEHKEAYLNSRERMNPELEEKLKSNTTELAKNPAFPKTDKDGNPINFLELIAYKRFNDTVAKVKQYTNVDGVSSNIGLAKLQPLMMQSVRNVIAFEKPHKQMLEKLAVDLVIEEMEIPQDAFQFDSKIVPLGGVSNEGILQDTKEPSKSEVNAQFGEEYPIEEMTPSEYFELLKHKRRFINLLIQGSSKKGHYMFELIRKKLNGINPTLTDNYGILMSVNDLTYWVMSDSTIDSMASNSQNMSGREEIDNETTPATIKTESICFPVSVHELIKGVMEVFGTQGLPDDKVSAQMLIDSVDSIKNETMDLRFGVVIWEKFISAFPMETFEEGSKNLQHHLFSKFCALEINEFFKISRYILSNDERGANYLENMLREIKIDLSQNDMSDLFGDYDDDNQNDDEYAEGGEVTRNTLIKNLKKGLVVTFKEDIGRLKYSYTMFYDKKNNDIILKEETERKFARNVADKNIREENNIISQKYAFELYQEITGDRKGIKDFNEFYDTNEYAGGGEAGEFEYVYWDDIRDDKSDDNDGYIYGINLLDENNEVLDVQWFKTEEERDSFISDEGLVEVDYESDDEYAGGGSIDGWEDISYIKPNLIQVSETSAFGNPDKLILKYNGKKIAQFYFNMRGYNSDFSLKNSEGVHYGFGGDKSKTRQIADFKKALKDGFVFVKNYSYAGGGSLDISNREKVDMYSYLDEGDWSYESFMERYNKDMSEAEDIIESWAKSRGFDKKYAKGGKTYVMTDDTYVNIFLSRGFTEKRSAYGLRFFEHKPTGIFITYDQRGIQTPVIISTNKSGEESIYEGNTIREVKQALDNAGVSIIKEGIDPTYAEGGKANENTKEIDIDFMQKRYFVNYHIDNKKNIEITSVSSAGEDLDYEKFGDSLKKIILEEIISENDDDYAEGGKVEDWMEEALESLIQETGFDELEITMVSDNGNEFIASDDNVEYRVFKTEDDAEEKAIEGIREDMEESPENFNFEFLMNNVYANDFLTEELKKMNYSYAKDITSESDKKYANRLIAEMVENGLLDEDDAKSGNAEELADDLKSVYVDLLTEEQLEGGSIDFDYFINNYGEEETLKMFIENNVIDIDEASKDAVQTDGIAHFLSSYDGETLYLNNYFFAYRVN